jgi:hypothetical protein
MARQRNVHMTKTWLPGKSVIALLAFICFALAACSPKNFTTSDTSPVSASCTAQNINSIERPTKLLFVVDTSGSNALYTQDNGTRPCTVDLNSCTLPTDPDKTFRVGAISGFLQRYRHKTNFSWGLASFSDEEAYSYVVNSQARPAFTSHPSIMSRALSEFQKEDDSGSTPYKAALQMAYDVIRNDPDRNKSPKPQYLVLLITDGFPTDYRGDQNQFLASEIDRDIANVLSAAPNQVFLSTVYYGQVNDPGAINLLRGIAEKGNGYFGNAATSPATFKIDDLIPGSRTSCD